MKRNAPDLKYFYHVIKSGNDYKVKRSLFVNTKDSVAYFSTKKQADESIIRRSPENKLKEAQHMACLVALEFGYVQCERGENLQAAIMNYNKILNNK